MVASPCRALQNMEIEIQNPESRLPTAFLSAEQECRSSSAFSGVTSCICSQIDCATFSCLEELAAALSKSRSGTRRNGHRAPSIRCKCRRYLLSPRLGSFRPTAGKGNHNRRVLSTRAALQNSFGKQQHQFLAQSRLRSTCSPSSLSPIPTRQNLNQPECLTAIPSAPASPPTQT
jgi:hypothetical protein